MGKLQKTQRLLASASVLANGAAPRHSCVMAQEASSGLALVSEASTFLVSG